MRYLYVLLTFGGISTVAGAQYDSNPPRPAQAKPASGEEIAAKVKTVFRDKCAACHGSDSKPTKAKRKFGYVDDLKLVAANPKLVVPKKPDESKVWDLVTNDEMPPEDAKTGPLSTEQKEIIQQWIAAGAPLQASDQKRTAATAADSPLPEATRSLLIRALYWQGRFHVVVIHFPIALIMAAAAAELFLWLCGSKKVHPSVRYCTILAAVAGVPAAVLGWLLALDQHASAPIFDLQSGMKSLPLFLHRWLGTAAAVLLVIIAAVTEIDARHDRRSVFARVLLFAGALLTGLAGHFGGIVVHGENWFDW